MDILLPSGNILTHIRYVSDATISIYSTRKHKDGCEHQVIEYNRNKGTIRWLCAYGVNDDVVPTASEKEAIQRIAKFIIAHV